MKLQQTVEWLDMPDDLRTKFAEDYSPNQNWYINWDSGMCDEDDELANNVDKWLVSQGCNLQEPILILVWW